MPLPFLTVPRFPDVPQVLGVPPLLRSVDFPPLPNPAKLFDDAPGLPTPPPEAPRWGIFDSSGNAIIVPDSIAAFSYANEFRISDYPVEKGAFASYNKVAVPYDARIVMTKSGKTADRQSFLDTLETIAASLDLYDVVTPDKTYINANITRFDYERSADHGVQLLRVAMFLREIRLAPTPTTPAQAAVPTPITDAKAPSAIDKVSVGALVPSIPTPAQIASTAKSWATSKVSQFTSGITGPWNGS